MLNSIIITVPTKNGDLEIFLSPILLHSKDVPDLKSGIINKLYFYVELIDEEYKENLKREALDDKFKSENYIISYGQNFESYYLGSLYVDFESKSYWHWEGKPDCFFSEHDVTTLGEALFNPDSRTRQVTMLTPTRPAGIKLALSRK